MKKAVHEGFAKVLKIKTAVEYRKNPKNSANFMDIFARKHQYICQ